MSKQRRHPAGQWGRLAGGLALAGLLVGATWYNDVFYRLLGAWCQAAFGALGLARHLPAVLRPGSVVGQVMNTPHSIPAVLAYSLLYLAICLALLLLLLPQAAQRHLVFMFYGLASLALLALLAGGRAGHSASLLLLGKQLIHFVVSPLPVLVLVPLLWWYVPPVAPAR